MDILAIGKRVSTIGKKYRYALLVVLLGIGLLLLPNGINKTQQTPQPTVVEERDLSKELTEILSQIDGAGKVKVMLTVAEGERIVYQIDEDITGGESGATKGETVVITQEDRSQTGLIRQVIPPVYQGALIVCQGAQKPTVRLAIVEAVSNVTGLGSDKITVVKMK